MNPSLLILVALLAFWLYGTLFAGKTTQVAKGTRSQGETPACKSAVRAAVGEGSDHHHPTGDVTMNNVQLPDDVRQIADQLDPVLTRVLDGKCRETESLEERMEFATDLLSLQRASDARARVADAANEQCPASEVDRPTWHTGQPLPVFTEVDADNVAQRIWEQVVDEHLSLVREDSWTAQGGLSVGNTRTLIFADFADVADMNADRVRSLGLALVDAASIMEAEGARR